MRKVYNSGSGCDLPSILWIHLTVHPKFGVSLMFRSGVIVCQKLNSNTAMVGKCISDGTPCCFSEATLGEFSATADISRMLKVLRYIKAWLNEFAKKWRVYGYVLLDCRDTLVVAM